MPPRGPQAKPPGAPLLPPPGPTLREAIAAALRVAQADRAPDASWARRARRSAALPTLVASYDARTDRGWRHDAEPGTADALVQDAGSSGVARARATWELDRLVFNLDEIRAHRAAADHRDWRNRLLFQVTQLYFARWRAHLDVEAATPGPDRILRRLERLEFEAQLEVLTGLRWSPRR
ncbi:MAG: hypothetical protein B7733_09170 [Myxococcales bacterium FL481]|nr:MAG: hypothetical protein B7733_09170 [Myxococcales bacterium FL481]